MNTVTLPPSPNWYLSNILVCAKDGTVAWGAKNMIVIARSQLEEETLHYDLIKNAHADRVSALSFSPEFGAENKNLLLSCGDDNVAKIWNLDNLTMSLSNSTLNAKEKIRGIDWFKAEPSTACFVSEDGNLVHWNVKFNTSRKIALGKMTANCLSCCPHESNLVAIGVKSGLLYIVDTRGTGSILYKLRGHNTELVSLSWCPVQTNVLSNSDARDLLLASGGKDRSIFIWRAGGDGRYEAQILVPSKVLDTQQHRGRLSPVVGTWLALNWSEPKVLLASSAWGELISWDLNSQSKNKFSCKVLHALHNRGLFCIATVPNDFEEEEESVNWRTKKETTIWTLAQERKVICCTLKAGEISIKYNLPSQGSGVTCIAACPVDPNRIAFACGDAMIRVWNLSEPHKTSFDITTFWEKIMGRIRAIAWHPEKENLLAFATAEGRIGVIDVNAKKPPILYNKYHTSVVWTLSWGPIPGTKTYGLYSVGNNELVYYDADKPDKEPKSFIQKHCTDISWKPDDSCFATGFEDGNIKFYNRDLTECKGGMISVLNKAVYCLVWHPQSTASDASISAMQNYLAVAVKSTDITIFEILGNDDDDSAGEPRPFYKTIATLRGHSDNVATLAWSPHISGRLISGSYDHTIQVWKVETCEILGTFTGHVDPIFCCMWSPLDPDLIMSGSIDFTLRIWRLSEQRVVKPSEKASGNTKIKKKKKVEKNGVSHGSSCNDIAEEKEDQLVTPRDASLPSKETTKKTVLKKSGYFPQYHKSMLNKAPLSVIRNTLELNESSESSELQEKLASTPSIFYNKETTSEIIDKEIEAWNVKKNYNVVAELELWRNNLKKTLEEATKENRLTDQLVSLAPSLSMKTWQDTCEAYAMQLIAHEKNFYKAVSYLLSIHKILEAVSVFIDAQMYKEAYVLATCKLDPEHPIFRQILTDYGNCATKQGAFEDGTHCWVKLSEYVTAAKLLARRNDLSSLELALDIAIASKDEELIGQLAEQTLTLSLCNSNISTAKELIKKCPRASYREVHVDVCDEIFQALKVPLDSGLIYQWLVIDANQSFFELLRKRYEERRTHLHSELMKRDFNIPLDSESALWVTVGYHISIAIISETETEQLEHIATALGIVFNFQVMSSQSSNQFECLMRLFVMLFSKSPDNEDSSLANTNLKIVKSLRAYLCYAIMSWFSRSSKPSEDLNWVRIFVEKCLQDAFDQEVIKYWDTSMKINKNEAELSLAIGKVKLNDEETEKRVDELRHRLNKMKIDNEEFILGRVCVPNPVVVYGTALKFADSITDEEHKSSFIERITGLWRSVSMSL